MGAGHGAVRSAIAPAAAAIASTPAQMAAARPALAQAAWRISTPFAVWTTAGARAAASSWLARNGDRCLSAPRSATPSAAWPRGHSTRGRLRSLHALSTGAVWLRSARIRTPGHGLPTTRSTSSGPASSSGLGIARPGWNGACGMCRLCSSAARASIAPAGTAAGIGIRVPATPAIRISASAGSPRSRPTKRCCSLSWRRTKNNRSQSFTVLPAMHDHFKGGTNGHCP